MLGRDVKLRFNWFIETMAFEEWRGEAMIPESPGDPAHEQMMGELMQICGLIQPWIRGVLDMTLQEYIDKMGFRER